MRIESVHLHNFRNILDANFNLHGYTLLIGANNVGKSTIIDAMRAFYEYDGFKFSKEHDFPFIETSDSESWIDITFILDSEEYNSLAEDYKLPDNKLKVRKYFKTDVKLGEKKAEGFIFGYTLENKLSENSFYGAKNIQSGKFGDVVYIPAVSKLDEHTKLTGPSVLRDLLNNILSDVVANSNSFKEFSNTFDRLAGNLKREETSSGQSLQGLEDDLNALIESWNAKVELNIHSPSTTDIIKSMLKPDFYDHAHAKPTKSEQFGTGFQRHLIYSLIQIGAQYAVKKTSKTKKDFIPDLSLILFEEPEAFLHPPQQEILANNLTKLSENTNKQILCSTHSPNFVSKSVEKLTSLVTLRRSPGKSTLIYQIDQEKLTDIVDNNQELNTIMKDIGKQVHENDTTSEMEAIKYALWLNAERSSMFFSEIVVLVEGATEKALINKLIHDGKITTSNVSVFLLDSLGKYNIHRFMQLCSILGIRHAVIHDDDSDNPEQPLHEKLNDLISKSKTTFTIGDYIIPENLEKSLKIHDKMKGTRPDSKPQHVLYLYDKGEVPEEQLSSFCRNVSKFFVLEDE